MAWPCPFGQKHVRKFSSNKTTEEISKMNSKEFKQACQLAAEEFFWKELHLTNINVVESKLSQNNKHGILWIKIRNINHQKCLNTVTELSKGKLLDTNVQLLTKIPCHFWARNKSL